MYALNCTLLITRYESYCIRTLQIAHGACLCQLRPLPNEGVVEEPIRFLGGVFHGPQTRWSTIEKEAYAIYWALLRLDDLVG